MSNDNSYALNGLDAMKRKKDSFTLDFNAGNKKARTLDALRDGILSSPDVGLLKLATPELERFIIHQSGTPVATPTQILFPKSVTEEQEAYARGFVDALVELHMKQNPLATSRALVCMDSSGSPYVALTPILPHLPVCMSPVKALKPSPLLASPVFTRPVSLDLTSPLRFLPTISPFTLTSPLQADTPSRGEFIVAPSTAGIQEESRTSVGPNPATTPCSSKAITSPTAGESRGVSPIDMSNQEKIKLERKREKNRNAAQRCRYKKLERISRLQVRVNELKNQNKALSETALSQKDTVARLRQQIVDHVHSGCQIMVVKDGANS